MIAKIMHILRKKIFLSFSGNLIFAGIGMLNFLLLTRSLEQTEFGDWVIFITVAGFIDMFRFGLTRNAIVRFSSSVNVEEKKNIFFCSFLFKSKRIGEVIRGGNGGYHYFFLKIFC